MWILGIFVCCWAVVSSERLYGQTTLSRRHSSGDRNDQYVRVEAELIKLTNDGGLTSNNAYCDTLGNCDPVIYAHLDTDRPNAEWPGAVALEYWPEIFRVDNVNSPLINKKITRDSCAKPYKDAVLRVYAEDYDPASRNDQINQWQCPITRSPADSEASSTWSPISNCLPKFHPGKQDSVTLSFRYRSYRISRGICDTSVLASTPRSAAGGTTVRSG